MPMKEEPQITEKGAHHLSTPSAHKMSRMMAMTANGEKLAYP